jgi:uncharacterized delta-60 repeat protein
MKTPDLSLTETARFPAFLLAAASLLCLLAPPAHAAPGDLDATFGTGGKVTTPIGSGLDWGQSVAVQSDGRIVVAGYSRNASGNDDFALVRYTSTGALDTSFNGTGKVTTPIGSSFDYGNSVALQSDGKIVVAGTSNDDIALVRYTSTGALDTSFNGTGKVTTPIGSSFDYGQSVAVQSDGRIVVAGFSYNASSNYDFALVRYTSTGALDTSFNGTGKVTTPIGSGGDFGSSVVVQSDGKIVVAGSTFNASENTDFALVRYTSTGALDTSFNGTGKVTTPIGSSSDEGYSVAVQSDGKIVVAGYSYNGSNDDFALVRYEGDPVDLDLDDDGLLDSWEDAHFGTRDGQSALDDTDHDGRVELLELAFGGDPLVSDPGATPAIIIEAGYLTTTITKQPGVTYLVQTAATPDAAFSATSTTVLTDSATTLKVRDNIQVGSQPARFLRVKVTAVP